MEPFYNDPVHGGMSTAQLIQNLELANARLLAKTAEMEAEFMSEMNRVTRSFEEKNRALEASLTKKSHQIASMEARVRVQNNVAAEAHVEPGKPFGEDMKEVASMSDTRVDKIVVSSKDREIAVMEDILRNTEQELQKQIDYNNELKRQLEDRKVVSEVVRLRGDARALELEAELAKSRQSLFILKKNFEDTNIEHKRVVSELRKEIDGLVTFVYNTEGATAPDESADIFRKRVLNEGTKSPAIWRQEHFEDLPSSVTRSKVLEIGQPDDYVEELEVKLQKARYQKDRAERFQVKLDEADEYLQGLQKEFDAEPLKKFESETESHWKTPLKHGGADQSGPLLTIAKYNYETFYSLPHGTVTRAEIVSSSAGIFGWGSCVLTESPSEARPQLESASCDKKPFDTKKEESSETELLSPSGESPAPSKLTMKTRTAAQRRGDEEEAAQLRLALLQSVGVKVDYDAPDDKSRDNFETDHDAEEVCYEYDEDGSSSEGGWSDEGDSEKDGTAGGGSEEDRNVARTARLRIEEPENGHERKDSDESFQLIKRETDGALTGSDAECGCAVSIFEEETSQHSEGSFVVVKEDIDRTLLTGPNSSD